MQFGIAYCEAIGPWLKNAPGAYLPPFLTSDVVGYSRFMDADEVGTVICTRSLKGMLTQKGEYPMTSATIRYVVDKRQRRHVDGA